MNTTNYLTICHYGHSRSVALARVIQSCNHPAIAIGAHTSGNAIQPLAKWAHHILTVQPHFSEIVPKEHQHKITLINTGPDIWSNPYNHDLLNILREQVKQKLGLEPPPLDQWK